jgi:hypothetical protein
MKHLSQIHKEFVKEAVKGEKWDSLSYDVQKQYLLDHPGTKRRITAPITHMDEWTKHQKFVNLETGEHTTFDKLPVKQQEALKAKFEEAKAKHQEKINKEKQEDESAEPKEKRKRFSIMGGPGEGTEMKADSPEDAMIKYLVKHEDYSQERAEQEVKALKKEEKDGTVSYGNFQIKQVSKEKKEKEKREKTGRKYSDRKIRRLARRVRRELKAAGKYDEGDETLQKAAQHFIDQDAKLKQYFLDKGIAEKDMAAKFAEQI